jgi:hypothetical protein
MKTSNFTTQYNYGCSYKSTNEKYLIKVDTFKLTLDNFINSVKRYKKKDLNYYFENISYQIELVYLGTATNEMYKVLFNNTEFAFLFINKKIAHYLY